MTLLMFLIIIMLFIFLTGICIGSFLNVVISRAFSNESICFPGSKCPKCQTPLRWYHNIPILSYLFLKGKCAFCKETIGIQYPIVELATGILFVIIFIKFGFGLNALFIASFISLFIVMTVTDIRERVVFNFHTYGLVILGLIYNFFDIGHLYLGSKTLNIGHFHFVVNNSFIASILGVLAGIIIMEAFARIGYVFAKQRAFGEGDTYIAAGLGAIFGWKYLITVLAYAFIIQVILTIPIFMKKLYTKKDYGTLFTFVTFFFALFIYKWFNFTELANNPIASIAASLLLIIIGTYLCKRIISGLKDKSSITYLPFGPAMVLGSIIVIFLFNFIKM